MWLEQVALIDRLCVVLNSTENSNQMNGNPEPEIVCNEKVRVVSTETIKRPAKS